MSLAIRLSCNGRTAFLARFEALNYFKSEKRYEMLAILCVTSTMMKIQFKTHEKKDIYLPNAPKTHLYRCSYLFKVYSLLFRAVLVHFEDIKLIVLRVSTILARGACEHLLCKLALQNLNLSLHVTIFCNAVSRMSRIPTNRLKKTENWTNEWTNEK